MKHHYTDEGVFIRSVPSRTESVTPEAIVISRILELWGADIIFIETAGLGQTQTEISSVSDFVVKRSAQAVMK
jgi:LAO/AO transport system kinase